MHRIIWYISNVLLSRNTDFTLKLVNTRADVVIRYMYTFYLLVTLLSLFYFTSFFENMSRIISPNYIPTEMDVLRVRVRTSGIIETQFQVNEITFRWDKFTVDLILMESCRKMALSNTKNANFMLCFLEGIF